MSCVALDARNEVLQRSMAEDTGIPDVREWGSLFDGEARFAVFTHQSWVAWVREHDRDGAWHEWVDYVSQRYGYSEDPDT